MIHPNDHMQSGLESNEGRRQGQLQKKYGAESDKTGNHRIINDPIAFTQFCKKVSWYAINARCLTRNDSSVFMGARAHKIDPCRRKQFHVFSPIQ